MAMIFDRVYKLTVGNDTEEQIFDGFVNDPLQITFAIDQTPSARLSWAEIRIFGLSRETREKIHKEFDQVKLVAGYRSNYGEIFNGTIQNVDNGRDGPNQWVRIFARSGRQNQPINQAWGENTPQEEIIRDVASALNAGSVELVGDFSKLPKAVKGKIFSGDARKSMDSLAESWDFSWMIYNGGVLVVKDGANLEGSPFKFSATTGMIGNPQITIKGVDLTVALEHGLKPWTRFEVESELGSFDFNEVFYKSFPESMGKGLQRVLSLQHNGDFYRGGWETVLEGIKV